MKFIIAILIVAVSLFCGEVYAQKTKVKGVVIDSVYNEPIPGVIVKFKGTKIGTSTDFDGKFEIETYYASDTLMFEFSTFQTEYRVIKKDEFQVVDVFMKEEVEGLPSLVVNAKEHENPAHPILRAVIRNKKINDREKLDAYQYEVYNKLEFDINNITQEFTERRAFRKFDFIFDNIDSTGEKPYLPVFLTETLSDYYFKKSPKKNKEVIRASRVSGIDNESVAQFTGDMYQQVNIYDNHVPVFGKNFVSPISNNGLAHYKYYLVDSMFIDGYWCYQLEFTPKRKQELTFTGDVWIHDTTYAVKRIEGDIAKDANINFVKSLKVFQEFEQVEDEVWMIVQDKLLVDFNLTEKEMGFYGRKSTSYTNFEINKPKNTEFYEGMDNIVMLDGASDKGEDFWGEHRHDSLTDNQRGVFEMMDTLGKVPAIQSYIGIIQTLTTGYKVLGKLEIGPYASMYSFNEVEGSRFSLGMRTSNDFSKMIEFSGYGAYGLKDQKFKYGLGTRFFITKQPRRMVQAVYKKDVEQFGLSQNAFRSDNVLSSLFRRNKNNKLASIDEFRLSYTREWFEGLSSTLLMRRSEFSALGIIPSFNDDSRIDGHLSNSIIASEVTFRTRWAHKEQYLAGEFDRISLGTKKPIITAQYTLGLKGVMGSQYEYHKAVLSWKHKIPMGIFGNFRYKFEAGKTWGDVPYPLLEIHAGNETYSYNNFAYNMMNLVEFVSDEYVSANAEHHFGGLFLNKIPLLRKLKWREVIGVKAVYGRFDDRNEGVLPLPEFSSTLSNKPYVEASVGIENIFMVLRIDCVWRMAYWDNSYPGIDVNKIGIRGKLQIDF